MTADRSSTSSRTLENPAASPLPALPGQEHLPDARTFYAPFHGHEVAHLAVLLTELRKPVRPGGPRRRCVWLVGDGALDNKYWLTRKDAAAEAVNGYPLQWMKRDVAYCVNAELVKRRMGDEWFCLNAAVEESTLAERDKEELLAQDEFARQWSESGDVFVVSIGWADVTFRPSPATLLSTIGVMWTVPLVFMEKIAVDVALKPLHCWVPGLAHFVDLFKDGVSRYLSRVAVPSRPAAVLSCSVFFPDTRSSQNSWATASLRLLNYDTEPRKLQAAVRTLFQLATSKVQVPHTKVVPVPLFDVLDGTDGDDYVERVQLSVRGGAKASRMIVDKLVEALRIV